MQVCFVILGNTWLLSTRRLQCANQEMDWILCLQSFQYFKLTLFIFLLVWWEMDWILCLPNGSIETWKELEDKYLEMFFTNTKFNERKEKILKILNTRDPRIAWRMGEVQIYHCEDVPTTIWAIWRRCKIWWKGYKIKQGCFRCRSRGHYWIINKTPCKRTNR